MDVRTISDHFPGIGRYVFNLAHACARLPEIDELVLLHNHGTANSRYDFSLLASESKVRMVASHARPFTCREQLELPLKLKHIAAEVIHFPFMIMPYAAPRPFVVTFHDVIPIQVPRYLSLWHRMVYRTSITLALRSAAAVICVSDATRSDLHSVFDIKAADISVIHEGVSADFCPASNNKIVNVRAKYELREPYLLYVGSNKPHKNLPLLVDAYARLKDPPLLVLAGAEDPRYPQTRRRVEMLQRKDRVRFVGTVEEADLPALYSGALAFIFPSTHEGFGLPPLEAMACGTPVACADIPSLREVAGDAALFFNPMRQIEVHGALERLRTDEELRMDLRCRGFRRAAEFSWNAAARQTLEVYRKVCKNSAAMRL